MLFFTQVPCSSLVKPPEHPKNQAVANLPQFFCEPNGCKRPTAIFRQVKRSRHLAKLLLFCHIQCSVSRRRALDPRASCCNVVFIVKLLVSGNIVDSSFS